MKLLLIILTTLLLSGCAAWGQFSDELFGANTKKTIKYCNDEGECTEIMVDGDQSDPAQILSVAAQLYGLEVTVEDADTD